MAKQPGRPPTKPNRVSFNIRIDKELRNKIKYISIEKEKSVSDIIHEALNHYLMIYEGQKARKE